MTGLILALACAQAEVRIQTAEPAAGAWVEGPDLLIQVGRTLQRHAPSAVERLPMGRGTFAWTLCRLQGSDGPAVALFDARGVFVHRRRDGRWNAEAEPLVVHPNLFEGTPADPPVRLDFMPRVDGDDWDDLLLFGTEVTVVMVQRPAGFEMLQKVRLPVVATESLGWWPDPTLKEQIRLPPVWVADLEGDGRRDLSCFTGTHLEIFPWGAEGLAPAPARSVRVVGRPADGLLKIQPPPKLKDVDGDGRPDLVHVNPRIGAAEIFYGRDGAPSRTDVEPREDGGTWGLDADVVTMTRDGKRSLVLRTVEQVGILDSVDLLKSRRAVMRVLFFPLEPGGRPARSAARIVKIPLSFAAEVSPYGFTLHGFVEPAAADWDGDGAKDWMVVTPELKLVRYPGDGVGAVEEEPVPVTGVDLPAGASEIHLSAVEGGARDGLLIRYREAGGTGMVRIVRLRGG